MRVLELGSFIAGPFAGQVFADLGADVIKVESPEGGDPMRHGGQLYEGRSVWWSALARSKRLVAVDLRRAEGQAVVRRLALSCDVVLENLTPGRLEEWGLGYEQLRPDHPRLVMRRVSGFGQTGPRAGEPGFGSVDSRHPRARRGARGGRGATWPHLPGTGHPQRLARCARQMVQWVTPGELAVLVEAGDAAPEERR